ncbi:uncharacterized protein LOC113215958 [Frankliniella occidentalis]|uniref:Uncharacterized protein LOC113215958 n=1 Tax=Frankliniella occidentalis TaxID=133901 RepID=A0A6J1TF82_FRAOC|nr:uncharacterized protein LOC113215958 [Frankliniella occidentalis]
MAGNEKEKKKDKHNKHTTSKPKPSDITKLQKMQPKTSQLAICASLTTVTTTTATYTSSRSSPSIRKTLYENFRPTTPPDDQLFSRTETDKFLANTLNPHLGQPSQTISTSSQESQGSQDNPPQSQDIIPPSQPTVLPTKQNLKIKADPFTGNLKKDYDIALTFLKQFTAEEVNQRMEYINGQRANFYDLSLENSYFAQAVDLTNPNKNPIITEKPIQIPATREETKPTGSEPDSPIDVTSDFRQNISLPVTVNIPTNNAYEPLMSTNSEAPSSEPAKDTARNPNVHQVFQDDLYKPQKITEYPENKKKRSRTGSTPDKQDSVADDLKKLRKMVDDEKEKENKKEKPQLRVNIPKDPRTEARDPKDEKPPPIVLEHVENYGKLQETLLKKIGSGKFEAKPRGRSIVLYTGTTENWLRLKTTLQDENYEFHTFSLTQDRPLQYDLKPIHHSVPLEDIAEELREHNFQPLNLYRKGNTIAIDLPNRKDQLEITKLTSFLHCKVTVTERSRATITICSRCCSYHHTQKNCHNQRRCTRCGDNHHSTECEAEEPRCPKCSGPHTIFEKTRCKAYKEEEEKIKKRKTPANTPAAPEKDSKFSFAQAVKGIAADLGQSLKDVLTDEQPTETKKQDNKGESQGLLAFLMDFLKTEILPGIFTEIKNWILTTGLQWIKELIPSLLKMILQ